ncbi:MAG: hypothetical protein ACXWWO_01325 [Candidatus Limnocylindria bacterium]
MRQHPGGIGLAYRTDKLNRRNPMGRIMLGVIIGIVLVIFLLVSCLRVVF